MYGFLEIIYLFTADPASRIIAAGLFLVLLGYFFHRYTGGVTNALFFLTALFLGLLFLISPAAHLISFAILLGAYVYIEARRRRTRKPYAPARAMVESGGIKRGLTPAEAAVLLEKPLNLVIGVVMAGLLRKGVVVMVSDDPIVLEVAALFQVKAKDPQTRVSLRRQAARANGVIIHPYEEPFLTQLENKKAKPVMTLNLVAPLRSLLRYTAQRVQGYNLPETREYYQKHLGRARHDVKFSMGNRQEERVKAQNFEWVLLDSKVAEVYGAEQPEWLPGPWAPGSTFSSWAERLLESTVTSVPPEGLQVKAAGGKRLAIGGRDPVRAEFFEAVSRNSPIS